MRELATVKAVSCVKREDITGKETEFGEHDDTLFARGRADNRLVTALATLSKP